MTIQKAERVLNDAGIKLGKGGNMKPIDLILATLPSLTDKEKGVLKAALNTQLLSPCERNGHAFKKLREVSIGMFWWKRTVTIMHCSKCNQQVEM